MIAFVYHNKVVGGGAVAWRTTYLDQQLRSSGAVQVCCSARSAHVIPHNVSQTHTAAAGLVEITRVTTLTAARQRPRAAATTAPATGTIVGYKRSLCHAVPRGSRRPWVPVSWDVVLVAGEADSRALSRH